MYTQTGIYVKRFKTEGIAFDLNFDDISNMTQQIGDIMVKLFTPDDLVGAEIRQSRLDRPILVPFMRNLTVDHILNVVERIQQSQRTLKFDGTFQLKLVKVYK